MTVFTQDIVDLITSGDRSCTVIGYTMLLNSDYSKLSLDDLCLMELSVYPLSKNYLIRYGFTVNEHINYYSFHPLAAKIKCKLNVLIQRKQSKSKYQLI